MEVTINLYQIFWDASDDLRRQMDANEDRKSPIRHRILL